MQFMRLTKASEYAIRCVHYLSMQRKGVIASRNEIADAMQIPREFLSKIAQQLSRSDILEIMQGPKERKEASEWLPPTPILMTW